MKTYKAMNRKPQRPSGWLYSVKILLAAAALVLLVSCSSDEAADDKQSAIDQAVQKTADTAVRYIKDPIEKAEAVKTVEEDRTRKLEEQVK